jgi:hypothetical protein
MREMALDFAGYINVVEGQWNERKTFRVKTPKEAAALGMGGETVRDRLGGSGFRSYGIGAHL